MQTKLEIFQKVLIFTEKENFNRNFKFFEVNLKFAKVTSNIAKPT